MPFWACISTVLCFICQPVGDELQGTLHTEAGRFFSWIAGVFNRLISLRRRAFEEVPVSSASIVGGEATLSEIRECLSNVEVGIVGICGMGGVGKTTLLQRINNDFFESGTRRMFDLVIWVTVSKEIDIPKIQKLIGNRLGLPFSESDNSGVPSSEILFKELSKKRFLLLLDDVWAKIDLREIGIPVPNSGKNQKIAFTTRSLEVCNDMDADKRVKVKSLDEAKSWELFRRKIRGEVDFNNPSILRLAEQVCRQCGGLPLALITVGRAMADKKLPQEWEHAVMALDHCAEKLRNVKDEVLSQLKFSYDYLKDDNMRSALLFCAMYPEDRDIQRDGLIEYWVGEGLLDGNVVDSMDAARNSGHVLISSLQDACLLEPGIRNAELTVRLHDAVRDMALWLNREEYDKVDGFLVLDGENSTVSVTPPIQRWEYIRRIFMLVDYPFSSLNIPDLWSFSNVMRNLRVLDLSDTESLGELPVEVGLLVGLRYLNLSRTGIRSLPKELGKLVELRQLLLDGTEIRNIPREAIVGLSSLQVLNMFNCYYDWDAHEEAKGMEEDTAAEAENEQSTSEEDAGATTGLDQQEQLDLGDVEGLGRLRELHMRVSTLDTLRGIACSDVLCKCLRRLHVIKYISRDKDEDDSSRGDALLTMVLDKMGDKYRKDVQLSYRGHRQGELQISLDTFPKLEKLELWKLSGEMRVVLKGGSNLDLGSLRWLQIWGCDGLKELKFVGMFSHLELIMLWHCMRWAGKSGVS